MAPNIRQTDIPSDRCPCDFVPKLLYPDGNAARASRLSQDHPWHCIIHVPFRHDEHQHRGRPSLQLSVILHHTLDSCTRYPDLSCLTRKVSTLVHR